MKNNIVATFDSKCSVTRKIQVTKPNGSKVFEDKEIYANIQCGLYVFRSEEYDQRRTIQPITGDFQVYLEQHIDIKAGDRFTFNYYGRSLKGVCGSPMVYETHQEVICRHEDYAKESGTA